MKKLDPGKDNREARMKFVRYWAQYVRNHDDEVWSKQQNVLINSQVQSARSNPLPREVYLKIKRKGVLASTRDVL